MSEIEYSKYQTALFDWIQNGQGNAVVEAIAGSGKSTTITHALKFIPPDQRIMFNAFNKSTVNELQTKIQQNNVTIRTSHSLGYLMLKTHFKYQEDTPALEVDEYKYRTFLKQNFNELTEGIEFQNKNEIEEFKDTVLFLINICRVYLCETYEDIEKIADKYGYSVTKDHINVINALIQWGWSELETVDFTDMICLPNYFNFNINSLKYDWVIIDECQDYSLAMQLLFQRCIKKNGRFIAVGDRKQAIMVFSGSDNEAFNNFLKIPNTTKLDLSINYRCPQVILPIAKRFVPQFELRNNAPQGKFVSNILVRDIKPNSMVICRNTAPLIELYLKLIQKNIKCYIKGIDIGANLIEIINRINVPYISNDFKKDGLIPILYKNLLESREKLMVKRGLDIKDATSNRGIIQQLEVINTIKALSIDINNTFELIDRIKKIFISKDIENGICLITGHKAKGLEHEDVYLLCPSLVPSGLVIKDWEKEAESNLMYVIYTRTKRNFYTVSEKDFPPPYGSKDINDIVTHLNVIEQCLKQLYNPQVEEIVDDTQLEAKIIKLSEIKKENQTQYKKDNLLSIEVVNESKRNVEEQLDRKIKSFEKIMLGKTVAECYDIFNDLGITNDIRVTKSDGNGCMVTCDFKVDRISVHTENDKVVFIEFGG